MKISIILIALAVSISGPAFAAGKDDHDHKAQSMHGGVTAQAKDVDYELMAKADKLQLFMRDHGKPVDVSSMTAKATLLTGSEKQEVQLQPVDGKLEATGNFKITEGTKAVVAVSKAGKTMASVRFTLK